MFPECSLQVLGGSLHAFFCGLGLRGARAQSARAGKEQNRIRTITFTKQNKTIDASVCFLYQGGWSYYTACSGSLPTSLHLDGLLLLSVSVSLATSVLFLIHRL